MGIPEAKPVSLDLILDWYEQKIESGLQIPPSTWLDAAAKLEVLCGDLDDRLVEKKMVVNRMISELILSGKRVSEAERIAKASEEQEEYLKLEAKRKRVTSFVQLAKKRTELSTWDK